MSVRLQALAIALLLVAATLAGWLGAGGPRLGSAGGGGAVTQISGAQLMAMTLPDAEGVPRSMRQWQGKLLVVNFWATWCPPCRREMPDFERASRNYSARGVQFVGFAIDHAEAVRRFRDEAGVSYPLLVGGPASVSMLEGLGNSALALPFTLVIGREGEIRLRKLGPMNYEALAKVLDGML